MSSPKEAADQTTQISILTAKLLEIDCENKRLKESIDRQESLELSKLISNLENQNGQLKNELEKERKVTILLQGTT